jgi:hypothetical protein
MLELPKVASNTITLTPKEGVQLLGGQMITLLYSTLHLDPLVLTRHVFVGLIQTLLLTTSFYSLDN